MDALVRLREMHRSGSCEVDGCTLRFEGELSGRPGGRTELERDLGYSIPEDVAGFIEEFGGTGLFVDEYGLGVRILPFGEIARVNEQLQASTEPFWPQFALIGFDSADDMLCLYSDGELVHFGNLHHEAWEAPHLWASEAMSFAPFAAWLRMFVATGETIPGKDIRYAL